MKSSMAMTAYLCQRACSVFSVCSMRWFGLRRLLLLSLHPLVISDMPVPQTPRHRISPPPHLPYLRLFCLPWCWLLVSSLLFTLRLLLHTSFSTLATSSVFPFFQAFFRDLCNGEEVADPRYYLTWHGRWQCGQMPDGAQTIPRTLTGTT